MISCIATNTCCKGSNSNNSGNRDVQERLCNTLYREISYKKALLSKVDKMYESKANVLRKDAEIAKTRIELAAVERMWRIEAECDRIYKNTLNNDLHNFGAPSEETRKKVIRELFPYPDDREFQKNIENRILKEAGWVFNAHSLVMFVLEIILLMSIVNNHS